MPHPGSQEFRSSPHAEPPVDELYQVQPLADPRWGEFLERHPQASVFHTAAWLEALRRTYGYQPIVYTTSRPGAKLQDGLVFCRVDSWLTGRRLVSLPFSDHCACLVGESVDLRPFFLALERTVQQEKLRYVEIRPTAAFRAATSLFRADCNYIYHRLDLTPDLDTIFRQCHKDSTQRKIRRAEREGLKYEEGRSEALLEAFLHLHLLTRRRHQAPPQPTKWFQNLCDCFGQGLKIRVAIKNGSPVAGILTLRYKDALVYKYGCSDALHHNLGGMQLLLWRSIQEAKLQGLRVFDLGRSDPGNTGLTTFKDRWGADRSMLTYSRFYASTPSKSSYGRDATEQKLGRAKRVLSLLPDGLFRLAGAVLYKHFG